MVYLVHKYSELTNIWVGCMFIPLRMLKGKFKCMLERLKILYVNRLQRKKRWANGISSRLQYERTNWRGGISFSNYLFKDLFNSQHSYNSIFNAIKMGLSTIYRKMGIYKKFFCLTQIFFGTKKRWKISLSKIWKNVSRAWTFIILLLIRTC